MPQTNPGQPHSLSEVFISRYSRAQDCYEVTSGDNSSPRGRFCVRRNGLGGTTTSAEGRHTPISVTTVGHGPWSVNVTYGETISAVGAFRWDCSPVPSVEIVEGRVVNRIRMQCRLAFFFTVSQGRQAYNLQAGRLPGFYLCLARSTTVATIKFQITAPPSNILRSHPALGNHWALFLLWLSEYTNLIEGRQISLP